MAVYAFVVLIIVFFLTSVIGVVTGSNSLIAVPAMFQFGGLKRRDPLRNFPVRHGDVIVWGGVSRLAYHGVAELKAGEASVGTLREALQARSKISPQIRHVSRAEIEALQMPPQARKRRTFVDLR